MRGHKDYYVMKRRKDWMDMANTALSLFLWLLTCLSVYPNMVVSASISGAANNHASYDRTGYYSESIDFRSIQFLTSDLDLCRKDASLIIFIMSAVNHREHRDAIRESWGSVARQPESGTNAIFIVGLPPTNTGFHDDQVIEESDKYHDMLLINIIDSYKNLTIKSVAMLKWIAQHCPDAKYILKADDDTFVNTPLLNKDLQNIVHERFFMGDIIAGAHPIRDKHSKYFTPKTIFRDRTYPKYISGAAYIISGDIVSELYKAALTTKSFWLEDVFVTGLLGQKVQAKHIFNGKFSHRDKFLEPCQLKQKVMVLHRVEPYEMKNAWELLNSPELNCD